MRGAAVLALVLLIVGPLAGCLERPEPVEPHGDVTELLARPWLANWGTVSSDFVFHYDPAAQHVDAEGTLTIRNGLGADRGYVHFFLPGVEVTSVRDEDGRDLAFEREVGGSVLSTFQDVSPSLVPNLAINVTLTGDVAHGAERTLAIAYNGWASDATLPVPGGDELSAHLTNWAPLTTFDREPAEVRFTVVSPADWTVLAAAWLDNVTVENGVQVANYHNLETRMQVFSANGLQWFQDEVDGIDVRTYYYPDMAVQGRAMHDAALKILRFVPEWTGPYPYDHMWTVPHQVSVNAFNTPALSFMGWTFYRPGVPAPVQFGRDLVPVVAGQSGFEAVLVHEHVHNWWGQVVRGNNSNAELSEKDTWMSEGITTYLSETVWWDRLYDEDSARESADHMVRARQRSGQECGITEQCGDHYVKTALALRALEAYAIATERPDVVLDALKLGQERFGTHHGGPGLVDTPDMLAVFEESFGEDLAWWWEPWFYGRVLADLTVADVRVADGVVNVTVANVGDADAAALVQVETLAGQVLRAWALVPAGGEGTAEVDLTGTDGIVRRVVVDPLQHVYEADETNNVRAV